MITIDDAFSSFYENAWPFLKRNKIPFILFVSTEPVGKNGYMNWEQIKEVEREEFAFIGNHSHSHEYLIDFSFDEFKSDINQSINIFKKSSRIYSILSAEYGFKNLSDIHVPNLFKNLSRVMWKTYDELFIDKLIVNGIANKIQHISMQIRKIQTGFIYHYAFVMIISLMTLLWIFFGL